MIDGKRAVAIIPARGGSKGLPGKNVRALCGKPLIAWSIEQALACPEIDAVVVSTDSEAIAAVAEAHGARVPFLRPAELATDDATSIAVIRHALDQLEGLGESYEYVVLLEPTSPLRDVADIRGSLALLSTHASAQSVVGVAAVEAAHPAFLFQVADGGLLRPSSSVAPTGVRRQDLRETYYYLEGSVYASDIGALREHESFYHAATAPWVVQRYKALEVDELSDFITAEALMRAKVAGEL